MGFSWDLGNQSHFTALHHRHHYRAANEFPVLIHYDIILLLYHHARLVKGDTYRP